MDFDCEKWLRSSDPKEYMIARQCLHGQCHRHALSAWDPERAYCLRHSKDARKLWKIYNRLVRLLVTWQLNKLFYAAVEIQGKLTMIHHRMLARAFGISVDEPSEAPRG